MANHRKGRARGYNGQKGGAHTLAWDQDPIILGRIEAGIDPWMRDRPLRECLAVVNAWLAQTHPDEPPITLDTLQADRSRALELRARRTVDRAEEHLAKLDKASQIAWERLDKQKDGSQNVTGLINAIVGIVEKKAKLDGSLVERKQTAVTGDIHVSGEVLPALSPAELGEACAVLYRQSEEFRLAFDTAMQREAIDVTPQPLALPESGPAPEPESSGNGHVVDFTP